MWLFPEPGLCLFGEFGALVAALSVSGLAVPSVSLLDWGWLCLLAAGSGEEDPNLGEGERRQRGAGFQLPNKMLELAWEGVLGWLPVPLCLFPQPQSAPL